MKAKVWKILAIVLATAVILCTAVGCGDRNGDKNGSSAVSSEDTSKASPEEPSKASSESKAESHETSEERSEENLDVYFADISEQDAVAKALEELGPSWKAESSEQGSYDGTDVWIIIAVNEEDGQEKTAYVSGSLCRVDDADGADTGSEQYIGSWYYNVGDNYMGMTILEDGTVQANANEIERTILGSWREENGKLIVTLYGEDMAYTYDGEHLVEDDSGRVFFRGKIDNNEGNYIGSWYYNVGDNYMGMTILEDGTVQAVANEIEGTMLGSWREENGKLIVTLYGEDMAYTYDGEHLVEDDSGRVFFRGKIDNNEGNYIGSWYYNVGDNYMGMTILEDGTVQASANEIEGTMLGSWREENGKLIVTLYGEDMAYTYDGEHLVEDDSGRVFFRE